MPVHDRGRVLGDVAVCITHGGRVLSDLAALRDQPELYGPVASDPTAWRTLEAIGEPERAHIAVARAKTRRRVWALIPDPHRRDLLITVDGAGVVELTGLLRTSHGGDELPN